jgi:hypothetical protein
VVMVPRGRSKDERSSFGLGCGVGRMWFRNWVKFGF